MAHAPEVRLEWQGFKDLAAEANDALLALGKAASVHGLDKELQELIKIRVSQINGCAFCLQMHLDAARRMKIDEVKLNLIVAWREAPALTLLPQGVSDEVYEEARAAFSAQELADLTTAVVSINAWNRLGVGYRFSPILSKVQQRAS